MELPNHTFYVDDIYAYIPLPYCKKIFYNDLDFYHYFIGRADQSINFGTMCKRFDQQMRVFEIIFNGFTLKELKTLPKPLYKYMFKWVMTIMAITTMTIIGTKEDKPMRKEEYKKFLRRLKASEKKLYNKVRHRSLLSLVLNIPTYNIKSFLCRKVYTRYQRKMKLG